MKEYTVKQLARLAGVSVKTLHHYDRIGLLRPHRRSDKNYRYYGKQELYLLQQILFYREMQFPLQQIAEIIHDPAFDLLEALESHQQNLAQKASRIEELLSTIDKTINHLKNKQTMLKDEELYKGFKPEEVESMRKEVRQRWGAEQLTEVEERIMQLSSKEWEDHQQQGAAINQVLADLMELDPAHELVQKAVAKHHQYLNFFYEVTPERYLGLGKMYTEDDRFRAHYDQYASGLADFLYMAIQTYCDEVV